MSVAKIALSLFLFISFNSFSKAVGTDSIDIYIKQQQDLKALKYAIAQSELLLKNKSYKRLCDNNIKQSKIYSKLRDTQKSISVLFGTLKIAEKHHLRFEKVLILNEIAKNFQLTFNKVKSLHYLRKSEKIAKSIKNDTLSAFIQQGLFSIYVQDKRADSALYYMRCIMDTHKNKGNYDQIYRSYSNYSVYYFSVNDHALGKKFLDTSIYYAEKNKKIKYLKSCYNNLGYYYLSIAKDFKKGEQQFQKILALTPNDTTSADVSDYYLNLSYAYEQLGNFKMANRYLIKYIDNTSVIFENKINSQLRDAETKYEIEKIENEYKKRQIELEEMQSKNQKIFIVIIALLIILSMLFYFFNQNNRLKEKNKLKNIESKIQQNIINATLDGQEIERKKIAGVLHDSISAQLSSASLHLSAFSAISGSTSEEITKTRAILKDAHDKVRDLSHELLPTLLAKFGLLYALQDSCEKNSNSLIEFDYSSNISNKRRFNEDYEMKVYFIITELMNNILKHSNASKAKLTVDEEAQQLHIKITDNGKGFDTTKSKISEGFGLTQIRARILNMKGKFIIDSKPKRGTTITIDIPVEE